jgi:S1-C subfamily serine protease
LIIKIDGQSVNDISELKLELFFKKPDKPISITYKRDKKIITQSSK